ncbi:MAG TPA: cysteine desulfurase [Burkholderiales bacterium]|nr:cysteine desulfurase [Burkholderiales bacterium]
MTVVEKLKLHEAHPAYRWREDFPILRQKVHGRPLVYLDNAATSQKPLAVIEAEDRYYREYNSNIHRGVHALSQQATDAYEKARVRIQKYLNARSPHEIIFVRGATEGLNLVAQSFGRPRLRPGDEIIVSAMEHHSNIVPWQLACEQTGAVLKVVPMTDSGEFMYEEFERLLGIRTRIVAVTQVSNALGTILPVKRIIEAAHAQGVPVVLDGAQAIPHARVDVQALDCDFYAFSGHKVYGPTGIGVLYGKEKHLEAMPPWQGGGDMIRTVSFEKSTWNDLPYKFEAGTPHIAGGIGLGVALDYLASVGIEAVAAHEHDLLEYATGLVSEIPGVRLIGTAPEKAGVLSFVMDHAHPHDVGTILDHQGVAIRAGHHCAMPVMDRYNIPGTARASFALYNTREDVDALVAGIHRVRELFA